MAEIGFISGSWHTRKITQKTNEKNITEMNRSQAVEKVTIKQQTKNVIR